MRKHRNTKSKPNTKPNTKRVRSRRTNTQNIDILYGLHTVKAALENPLRDIQRVRITQNVASKLEDTLNKSQLKAEVVAPKELDHLLGPDIVHQGAMLEAKPLPLIDNDDIVDASPLLILDQITDPHNVGAILRSAAAFDVKMLIMTERHSPPLHSTLAKSASGALELVPICLVANLARALEDLGQKGYFRIGLDSNAAETLESHDLNHPIALVMGAEDKGLRRLTRENCDVICRLQTANTLRSLNVSNAAAIALHTIYTKNT